MEEDPQASAVQRDQAAVYEDSTREAVGNDFADWRFTKYIPSTTVDSFKTKVRGWLQKAADELVRRLDGRGAISRDDLRDVVCSVLDLFAGIETEKKEAAALRERVPLVPIVYRELGRRTLHSMDTDGFETGPPRVIVDFCYDVPVTCSLARLLQHDPRAWQMVQETMETWSRKRPGKRPRLEKRIIADLPDGTVFEEHPELGIKARAEELASGGTPGSRARPYKIAISLYYDGVNPCNALGPWANVHPIGAFYYSITNLDASIRTAKPYLQLVCMVNDNLLKHYARQIVSGNSLDSLDCSSFGGQMRKLHEGVSFDVPSPEHGFETAWVQAWCTLVKTDYLAGQKLGPWKESTQAHCYDRASTLDKTSAKYKKPTSYVRNGPGISNHWRVRTVDEIEREVQKAARLRSLTKRKEALDALGINESKYTFVGGRAQPNFALHHSFIPLLDWVRASPYDWMHVGPCGLARYEGAEMHSVFIRLRWYNRAALNLRIQQYPGWPAGHRPPPVAESSVQTGKGGLPKKGCSLKYSAAQTNHYVYHSVAMLTAYPSLIKDESHPVWRSWLAHVAWFCMAMSGSFDDAMVLDLDRAIYEHQRLYLAVKQYTGRYKPKHAMAARLPLDILNCGPLVKCWCMAEEAMNGDVSAMAEGGNFKDPCFRICNIWSFKSGLSLIRGDPALWGATTMELERDFEAVTLTETDETVAADSLVAPLFGTFLHRDASIQAAHISRLTHFNHGYQTDCTWVMAETVIDHDIVLAQVGGMRQLYGPGLCNAVLLQLFVFDWIPLRAQHNVIRVRLDDLRDTSRSTRNLGHAMCAGTAHPAPYQIYSLQELVLTPLHVTRRTPSEIDLVPLRFSL